MKKYCKGKTNYTTVLSLASQPFKYPRDFRKEDKYRVLIKQLHSNLNDAEMDNNENETDLCLATSMDDL